MKEFIFIPDTNKDSGLGHFFRCLEYSKFVDSKNRITFFIKKGFKKKYLKNVKIKYFYYNKLNSINLYLKKTKSKSKFLIIDSYKKKIHNYNFGKKYDKKISILDYKNQSNSDQIIDHTFNRKKNFHKKIQNQKMSIGHNFFPISFIPKKKNRNTILINFGSVKKDRLIKESLLFIKKLKFNKKYKIVLINDKINSKVLNNIQSITKHKIHHRNFISNIYKVYEKTFFSIGACGISLYERSFFNIPSICISVAQNQNYNLKNFYSNNCLLKYNEIIYKDLDKYKFELRLLKVRKNLKKYFSPSKNILNLKKLFKKI